MDTKQDQKTTQNEKKELVKIPEGVRLFLEGILQEADLVILDEQDYEDILISMFLQLDQFIGGKILEKLPDDQLEAYIELHDNAKNPQEMQEFLDKNLPEAKNIFQKAFEEFRTMYLENIELERSREDNDEENPSEKSSLEDIAGSM